MRHLLFAVMVMTMTSSLMGAIQVEKVQYEADGKVLQGYLAYDSAAKEKRHGVLVVHEWWGLNDYAKKRAEQVAGLGYVAFAVDMYGKDRITTDPAVAGAWAGEVRGNRKTLVSRMGAAVDALRRSERVDASRLAAIGYCFGGTVVLETARAGMDLRGVASFHGTLGTSEPAQSGVLTAKVLVLTGADDPMAPAAQISAFEDEMRKAGADWQVISYGGALHSFTNPDSSKAGMRGVGYNEKADRRSWQAMRDFFEEIFGGDAKSDGR
jgi:dienelactone hydrolase